MTCLECKNVLTYIDHKSAMATLGVELCARHKALIDKLTKKYGTPKEAIQLYYGLKKAGANPTLAWWDGKKSIDIAISRVKLNIEIDTEYLMITEDRAIEHLEETMHSFKNGFTTIRIPHDLVTYYFNETVSNILGIIEGLKTNIRLI
ncbi:hypothetical protein K8352_17235 [Flavobacteriaceae bacterium F89]|uniref:Uncharacterized protein n=1 Tax=Cerina litoralis TaxID=2874477 RepID=A0AAE3JSH3_9FLAO|nr:hypothetical protein [Cerina litoralis]MCG2462508.1 hypothetical protein [Cerina litoralis]